MSLSKGQGIKYVQRLAYRHPVLTVSLLEQNGIYAQLRYRYVQSGWLESLGRGAFKAVGTEITWRDALRALQIQLKLPVHAGAKTSFALLGRSHYLGAGRVYLFHSKEISIPQWFKNFVRSKERNVCLYAGNPVTDWSLGLQDLQGLSISSLERAALEQLSLVGTKESFDESFKLIEGLTAPRVALLQKLLENCSSVKTKRLFLCMAEHLNARWFAKLKLSKIDLGSGPRVIIKDGVYHAKYMIVAPQLE